MRCAALALLFLGCSAVHAADAPAPAAGKPATAQKDAAATEKVKLISDEEKWVFDPMPGRPDIFVDIEARMVAEKKLATMQDKSTNTPTAPTTHEPGAEQALEWSKRECIRIESLMVAAKWEEAMKACDVVIKGLSKYEDNDAVRKEIERVKGFRTQAEEAKIREEAQAKFDALDLRVEGILWSPEQSLAVISGEPRARGINERVKDCVIINIDTNRVDFLFHYNRRRFEFQRYVGEQAKDPKATAKTPAKTPVPVKVK